MKSDLILGQILALVTALTFADTSIIFSFLGKKISPATTVHMRLWVATPAILIIAFIVEGNFFYTTPLNSWIYLLTSGVFGYFLGDSFLFWAFANFGARETMVVMTLNPIFVAILSYFIFNETLTSLQIIATFVTLLGIIILILGKKKTEKVVNKNKVKGILCAFASAILGAMSNVLAKGGLAEVQPISSNAIRCIGGFIVLIIYTSFFRKHFKADFKSLKNRKFLILLVIASLTGPVLGMSVQLYAFTLAPIGIVSVIVQSSPIFILIYELIFTKKNLKLMEILGTIISVLGVILMFI